MKLFVSLVSVLLLFLLFSYSIDKKEIKNITPKNWPWRGVTIVLSEKDSIDRKTIDYLYDSDINFIRIRLSYFNKKIHSKFSVEQRIDFVNKLAKNILEKFKNKNVVFLISYTDFPIEHNKYDQKSDSFWNSKKELDLAKNHLLSIVKKFDNYSNIEGYDFFPEPVIIDSENNIKSPPNWNSFYNQILLEIRKISNKYLTYTPGPYGKPTSYNLTVKPIEDSKIIYNFHYYLPHSFTHQGIKNNKNEYTYPGMIGLQNWNINSIENTLKNVNDWRAKFKKELILVGEFGCVLYAKGLERYIGDLLKTFEKNNFSHSYFAANGWYGFSLMYENDTNSFDEKKIKNLKRSNKKTNIQNSLEENWKLNKK